MCSNVVLGNIEKGILMILHCERFNSKFLLFVQRYIEKTVTFTVFSLLLEEICHYFFCFFVLSGHSVLLVYLVGITVCFQTASHLKLVTISMIMDREHKLRLFHLKEFYVICSSSRLNRLLS